MSQPEKIRVCLVAPSLDIYGGQARQCVRLLNAFGQEPLLSTGFIPHNPRLPGPLRTLQQIKYVRTVATTLHYCLLLLTQLWRYDIVHVFSASYFSYLLSAAPAILIGKLYGKRVILNYRSGEAEDHLQHWPLTTKPVMRLADRIVVPSDVPAVGDPLAWDVRRRGPFHTGYRLLSLTYTPRGSTTPRTLPVHVWYPTHAIAGPHPVYGRFFRDPEAVTEAGNDRPLNPGFLGTVADVFTGDEREPDVPNPFRAQLLHVTKHVMVQHYVAMQQKPRYFAAPFASMLHDLAYEQCIDLHRHGERGIAGGIDLSCIESVGKGTAIDSLAAIKHLIYDTRQMSWDELLDALDRNWEGREAVRQLCLNAPKYGNGIAWVDRIGFDIEKTLLDYAHAHPKPNGQSFMLRCIPVTLHVPFGKAVWATPNGRPAQEFLSEGISASHGMDVKGPTTALASIASARCLGYKEKAADLINMKFPPSAVAGEEGTRRLMAIIRTWCDLKLWHVQFNVLNRQTLLEAQKDPEKYRNLVVRIAGYSAYFVDLSPMQQAEILARTEEAID